MSWTHRKTPRPRVRRVTSSSGRWHWCNTYIHTEHNIHITLHYNHIAIHTPVAMIKTSGNWTKSKLRSGPAMTVDKRAVIQTSSHTHTYICAYITFYQCFIFLSTRSWWLTRLCCVLNNWRNIYIFGLNDKFECFSSV